MEDQRTLCYGSLIVKRYRQPAQSQIAVLEAFEEAKWRKRVQVVFDQYGNTPKLKLNEAIKHLNRGQTILRFRGDGTGTGVIWELR